MARPWLRGAETRPSSSGTWPPARSGPPFKGIPIWVVFRGLQSGWQNPGLRRADKTIKLWDVATRKDRATFRGIPTLSTPWRLVPMARPWPRAARTRPSNSGTVATGKERPPSRGIPMGLVRGVQSRRQDSGFRKLDKTIKLWDVATGKEQATLQGHTDVGLLRGASVRMARLWLRAAVTTQSSSGTWPQARAGHPPGAQGPVSTSCGLQSGWQELWLTASKDQTVKLWEVATCKERASLQGHAERLSLASQFEDGTIIGIRRCRQIPLYSGTLPPETSEPPSRGIPTWSGLSLSVPITKPWPPGAWTTR